MFQTSSSPNPNANWHPEKRKMAYAYRVKISRHGVSDDDVWEINSYYRISDERGTVELFRVQLTRDYIWKENLIEIIRKTCLINKLGLRWAKLSLSCGLGWTQIMSALTDYLGTKIKNWNWAHLFVYKKNWNHRNLFESS